MTSETAWLWAVSGSTLSATRTTTVPRSNGPATAGVIVTSESGAPLYGPARYALPPSCSGLAPEPDLVVTVPSWLSPEQLGLACSALPLRAAAAAMASSEQ